MKKSRGFLVILLILACLAGLVYGSVSIISGTSAKSEKGIKLGLDLSGGVSITYRIVDDNPSKTDVEDTIAKLEERIEGQEGTTEYAVYKVGDDRITVEIPGVFDANKVLEELGKPGSLYFISHKDANGNENYSMDAQTREYKLNTEISDLIANGSVLFTGSSVKNATAGYQTDKLTNSQNPVVELTFDKEAEEIFANATAVAAETQDTIGIYYDDHFISVPTVKSQIGGGKCIIENMDGENDTEKFEKAKELATFIRVGAINLELEELESNVVGAQLGSDALETSLKAAIIGLALVMLFMIAMYGVSGVVASIALAVYSTLVVGFIYIFEVTLTLPGIAGVILGIGMAVDANVIIFARIREEIADGKVVSAAITEGYKKALSAILDGNVTTFIAAVVLMILGTGTVKGFAYTLMISIVLSMFTALFVAKWLMKALYAVGVQDEKFYGRAKDRKVIDFMKHKAVYFALSTLIILAGIGSMIGFSVKTGKSLNFGLEFMGGTSTTINMSKEYTQSQIESDIVPVFESITKDANIQTSTIDGTNKVVIKTRTLNLKEREELNSKLVETFGVDEQSDIETQSISSTISGEMRQKALIAVAISCVFMLLYIWFRFKDARFGASAIVALIHDVLVVLTAYAIIRISVGNTFIACMLTIVGYSVNDTIVIFDRIRENMHGLTKISRAELKEVANKSLTQTLARSINTSITTCIMVVVLYILGVSSIREFALPLMVGLICGSYSSIFIATELWYVMKTRVGKNKITE